MRSHGETHLGRYYHCIFKWTVAVVAKINCVVPRCCVRTGVVTAVVQPLLLQRKMHGGNIQPADSCSRIRAWEKAVCSV